MPLFRLRKTLTFCNISVITEDISFKRGLCVHYPKSNPSYQGKCKKAFFFSELCPFFRLRHFILNQAPDSQAWAPHAVLLLYIFVDVKVSAIFQNTFLRVEFILLVT